MYPAGTPAKLLSLKWLFPEASLDSKSAVSRSVIHNFNAFIAILPYKYGSAEALYRYYIRNI